MKQGAVQVGRNEPCPCGSRKRYMDCCLDTKYLITYNYKGQAVLIDKNKINSNLKKIITLDKSLNRFRGKASNSALLEVDDAIDILKETYDIIDQSLKEVEKFSSCSKSCCACCNKQPITTWLEVEFIKRFLKGKLDYNEFEMYIQNIKDNRDNEVCPFLSESAECTIYEVRPFNCRTYLVFSDPQDCSEEGKEVLRFSDAILDLASSTSKKVSLLSKNDDCKYVKKSIGFWVNNINKY